MSGRTHLVASNSRVSLVPGERLPRTILPVVNGGPMGEKRVFHSVVIVRILAARETANAPGMGGVDSPGEAQRRA